MRGNIQLKSGRNRMKCLLFAVLFLIAAVGVLTFSTAETQAATSTKKTVKIKLADKSGRYLLDTGYNWWLKEWKAHWWIQLHQSAGRKRLKQWVLYV